MSREWRLDPEPSPPRKTQTWEDVALAVQMVLETRADVKAPRDNVFALTDHGGGGGGPKGKGKENRKGGGDEQLPRASEVRGRGYMAYRKAVTP